MRLDETAESARISRILFANSKTRTLYLLPVDWLFIMVGGDSVDRDDSAMNYARCWWYYTVVSSQWYGGQFAANSMGGRTRD